MFYCFIFVCMCGGVFLVVVLFVHLVGFILYFFGCSGGWCSTGN